MKITPQLHLLTERHDIGGTLQPKMLVTPHLPRGPAPRLHLVDQQRRPVLLRHPLQPPEELRRSLVIPSFGLDRLHDHSRDGHAPFLVLLEQPLHLRQALPVLLFVLPPVLLQGVFVEGEVRDGPVEGGDVDLVDRFGVGGGEGAEGPPVERPVEGEDGEVRGAGGSVYHAGVFFFRGEGHVFSALFPAVGDEHVFVGVFVGTGAAHHCGYVR